MGNIDTKQMFGSFYSSRFKFKIVFTKVDRTVCPIRFLVSIVAFKSLTRNNNFTDISHFQKHKKINEKLVSLLMLILFLLTNQQMRMKQHKLYIFLR